MAGLFVRSEEGHKSLAYRPDIDGLRGIAVLLVLIFHFDLFNAGKAGFIGVDIFFVISGYLISKIIWSGIDSGSFSFRQFYIRRIRRLAPPLAATLMLTLFAGTLLLLPQELVSLAKEGIAALIYGSNIYYWRTLNYFGMQASGSFFLHTWSLAVEEQFYLFFPVLLLALHRFFPMHRAMPLLIAALASFSLNLVMVGIKPEATFYLLPTRAWELLLGAVLAAIEFRLSKSWFCKLTAGIFAIVILVYALIKHDPATTFPGTFALLPVLSAVLLLYAGSDNTGSFGRGLSFAPLRFVGVISYSLYLVHWPVKVFLPLLVFDHSIFWKIFGFVLSFFIAILMYLFVERPSKTIKVLSTVRGVTATYVFSTIALIALFGSVILIGGWRERFSPEVLKLADASIDKDDRTQICTLENAKFSPACHLGDKSATLTWLIIGDSHAQALSGAFDEWLDQRGEAGLLIFHHGCAPVYGIGDSSCQDFVQNVRTVWKEPNFQNVFLVSIWRVGLEGGLINDEGRFIEPNSAPAYVGQKYSKILNDIKRDGRRAYLWKPLPPAIKSLPFSLARSKVFGRDWELGREREEFNTEYRPIYAIFNTESDSISGFADPAIEMCSTGTCLTSYNGRPIYFDNNHPASSQKHFFARILANQIIRNDKRKGREPKPQQY